jgi:hypothetical protein
MNTSQPPASRFFKGPAGDPGARLRRSKRSAGPSRAYRINVRRKACVRPRIAGASPPGVHSKAPAQDEARRIAANLAVAELPRSREKFLARRSAPGSPELRVRQYVLAGLNCLLFGVCWFRRNHARTLTRWSVDIIRGKKAEHVGTVESGCWTRRRSLR